MTNNTEEQKNRFAFTEKAIDALPFEPKGKQRMFYDTNSRLALRVLATKKVFYVQKRVPGEDPIRVKVGDVGDIGIAKARQKAEEILGKVAAGINPHEEKKKALEQKKKEEVAVQIQGKKDEETLQWLLDKYKVEKLIDKNGGKQATLDSHEDAVKFFTERDVTLLKRDTVNGGWVVDETITLESWLDRPIRKITRSEVLDRFKYFSRAKKSRGADLVPMTRTYQLGFKTLQSAFNHHLSHLEPDVREDLQNPAQILSDHKLWKASNTVKRLVDFRDDEGPLWWNALEEYKLRNFVAYAYIVISLLQTGRSIDICSLRFDTNVNMNLREITYFDTKNHNDYTLCITNFVYDLLVELKKISKNGYVFYYPESKTGYIPKDAKAHFDNVFKRGGKLISHHDLRRTWTRIADRGSMGVSEKTKEYCLKHEFQGVSKNYYIANEDEIRMCMQKVEDYIFERVEEFKQKRVEQQAA
ncbi:integrase family protein [Paraburkholderia fungorum]|jgi:hypothetical protein|uniref:integrase family protein n=1 Tax=Paraburkholderia fungorum TaxID=134537 RepID=UPI000D048B00|nr:integrase family protein [Paraburkholderia fungorum]PRZ50674.1 uncharacterized protein DUF4102 [Paraburkholderia fungorum]